MPEEFATLTITALLHDTVEDSNATEKIIKEQFGKEIARLVMALSHDYEEEPDEVYLAQVVRGGKLALLVKRFDRIDNILDLANADKSFCDVKITELQKALPLWQKIDPETARQIKLVLEKIRKERRCRK